MPVKASRVLTASVPVCPVLIRHPLSAIFGSYVGTPRFRELVTSIMAGGQIHPIVLYQNTVLDGWHRYLACLELGIDPQFQDYTGPDEGLLTYVLGAGVARRQMSQSQYAICAARLMRDGDGSDTKYDAISVSRAFGVGETSLVEAGRILRHGVESIVEMVERGDVSAKAASRIVTKLSPNEQTALAKEGAGVVMKKAKALASPPQEKEPKAVPAPSPPPQPPPQLTAKNERRGTPVGDSLQAVANDLRTIAVRIAQLRATEEGSRLTQMIRRLGLAWFDGDDFVGLDGVWRMLTTATTPGEPPIDNLRQMLRG